MPSQNTIYVAWRGTDSELNEEMDFAWKLVPYDETWPECECRVHEGIDEGINGSHPSVLEAV